MSILNGLILFKLDKRTLRDSLSFFQKFTTLSEQHSPQALPPALSAAGFPFPITVTPFPHSFPLFSVNVALEPQIKCMWAKEQLLLKPSISLKQVLPKGSSQSRGLSQLLFAETFTAQFYPSLTMRCASAMNAPLAWQPLCWSAPRCLSVLMESSF